MNYNYYPSPPPYAYVPQWYQQNGNQHSPLHDTVPTATEGHTQAMGIGKDVNIANGTTTGRQDSERDRGYERTYRYRSHDGEALRGALGPPRSEQREEAKGSVQVATGLYRHPASPNPTVVQPHTYRTTPSHQSISQHPLTIQMSGTRLTTLLTPAHAYWLVMRCAKSPKTMGPWSPSPGNRWQQPSHRHGSESAVDAAERLMERLTNPGTSTIMDAGSYTGKPKRIIHLEEGLGYNSERSTLPPLTRSPTALCRSDGHLGGQATHPVFVGEPWDTERDPNKPRVPSLATPDLSDTVDSWALWLIVNATTKEHPGITWTQSGHVDLATVQTHLLLHRLIRGIFGTVDVYTERVRTAKKNFVLHFIDIVAIPDLYGQKLSELEIVANSGEGIDFKSNSSIFEENSEVVKHLADCGVSVDDMAEGFAFGQQWIIDKTWDLEPHSLEFRRYQNLLKRSRARLQFTHVVPIDNRSWTLPEEWNMEDVVEHRRRKHIQNLYRNHKVLKRDAWRFTRSVPRVGNVGINTLSQLARGIDGMQI
ncbi:hypothetical protein DFJ43DRAFT_1040012 [Lentinula guzmanii]|uniref:Uncharacterized protein n=1 Tax=Lentinula guzmanii TaxID=2804957 RepID=A0AA38JL58_9AGAR|nr:hypothetical protein DFJ43DRAFT_1040012 [Lentinula guzmanii]